MPNCNTLNNSTSPYLLQHAENPVHWQSWSEKAFQEAKDQNKLVIVSIGYSSCHWCHVMEKESFEKEEVAQVMNENFISIKVDREEYPDIDAYYMLSVQLMTGQGGWPLNVVCLPDGRPVWGGTYFPKTDWIKALGFLTDFHQDKPAEMQDYADKLESGMGKAIEVPKEVDQEISINIEDLLSKWKEKIDPVLGGFQGAPKFALPSQWEAFFDLCLERNDEEGLRLLETTIDAWVNFGLFDQIGGGFTRYSTDHQWLVPHFEKMLYDNGQMIGLISKAHRHFQKTSWKKAILLSLNWLEEEMKLPSGVYASALDADSEGEEGKYYVWNPEELKVTFEKDYPLLAEIFGFNGPGKWEENKFIPIRKKPLKEIAKDKNLSTEELQNLEDKFRLELKKIRDLREKPGLDYKALLSWNGLLLSGLSQAILAFPDHEKIQNMAINLAKAMLSEFKSGETWYHNSSRETKGREAILEDYAFAGKGFLDLFLTGCFEDGKSLSMEMVERAFDELFTEKDGYFKMAPSTNMKNVNPGYELQDNVCPSPNAILARLLLNLDKIEPNQRYVKTAKNMLNRRAQEVNHYPPSSANWLALWEEVDSGKELVISTKDLKQDWLMLSKVYFPNTLTVLLPKSREEALFKNRFVDELKIYPCQKGNCAIPLSSWEEYLS